MSNGLLINEYNVFGIRNPPAASHLTDYAPQAWQTTDSAAVNWGTFSALKTKVDTFLDPQNGETIATALDSLGEIQTFLANDGGGFGTAIVNSLGLKADKATPIFTGDITFKDDSNNTVGTIAGATGNTSFSGTLTVGGNTTLSGTLGVTGATTLSGNVSIADTKTLTVGTGATVFGGTVTLAAAPASDLQAATKKYVDDTAGSIDTSTLAPKASPTFTGTMTLPAAVSSATATVLTLTDNAAKPFTISSAGKDDILSVVTTDSSEGVAMSGTLTVTGALTASSTAAITSNATVGGTLGVTGVSTLAGITGTGTINLTGGTTTVAAPSADTHASTKKYVDDTVAAIDLTPYAAKAGPTFTGTVTTDVLTSGGAFTASTTATITGALTASSTAAISGNTTVGGTLGVTGVSTLAGITGTGTINLTGGTTTVATPTADSHASTKAYVDQVAQGLDVKESCRVATTANITLNDVQDVDGITLVADDRVLVKNQTTASQNGIYVVVAGGDWTRATDFDGSDVTSGAFTFVETGTVNANAGFVLSTNGSITVGTTDLAFTQFSGAGAVTAGTGLSKSGNTLSVDAAQTGITSVGTLAGLTATGTIDLTGGTTTVAAPSADTHASTKKYVDDTVGAISLTEFASVSSGDGTNAGVVQSKGAGDLTLRQGDSGGTIKIASGDPIDIGRPTTALIVKIEDLTTHSTTGFADINKAINGTESQIDYLYAGGGNVDPYLFALKVKSDWNGKTLNQMYMSITPGQGYGGNTSNSHICMTFGYATAAQVAAGNSPTTSAFLLNVTGATANSGSIATVNTGTPHPISETRTADEFHLLGIVNSQNQGRMNITVTFDGSRTMATDDYILVRHAKGADGTSQGNEYMSTGDVKFWTAGSGAIEVSAGIEAASTLAVTGASTLTGAVTAASTLAVTGATTLTGALTASSTAAITGNTTVGGTLGVTGVSTLAGITGTGTINLTGGTTTVAAPTADAHASTKKYVDDTVGAVAALDSENALTIPDFTGSVTTNKLYNHSSNGISFNGNAIVTGTAASTNTASAIVKRDSNGDFVANKITTALLVTGGVTNASGLGTVDAVALNTTPTTIHCDSNRTDSYTEDGSRAYPYKTLNAAMTAKCADGQTADIIFTLAPGTYTENIMIKKLAKEQKIHIRGEGEVILQTGTSWNDLISKRAAAKTALQAITALQSVYGDGTDDTATELLTVYDVVDKELSVLFLTGFNGVTVENLTFRYTTWGMWLGYPDIANNTNKAAFSTRAGVYLNKLAVGGSCGVVKVLNCCFKNCGSNGNADMHNGTLSATNQAIYYAANATNGGPFNIVGGQDVEVKNNYIYECVRGIRLDNINGGMVMNNRVERILDNGLYCAAHQPHGTATYAGVITLVGELYQILPQLVNTSEYFGCRNVHFINNVVNYAGNNGILVIGGGHNVFNGNTIRNCWASSIHVTTSFNNNFQNNNVFNCNWNENNGIGGTADNLAQIIIDPPVNTLTSLSSVQVDSVDSPNQDLSVDYVFAATNNTFIKCGNGSGSSAHLMKWNVDTADAAALMPTGKAKYELKGNMSDATDGDTTDVTNFTTLGLSNSNQ